MDELELVNKALLILIERFGREKTLGEVEMSWKDVLENSEKLRKEGHEQDG